MHFCLLRKSLRLQTILFSQFRIMWLVATYSHRDFRMVQDEVTNHAHYRPSELSVPPTAADDHVSSHLIGYLYDHFPRFPTTSCLDFTGQLMNIKSKKILNKFRMYRFFNIMMNYHFPAAHCAVICILLLNMVLLIIWLQLKFMSAILHFRIESRLLTPSPSLSLMLTHLRCIQLHAFINISSIFIKI